MRGRQNGRNKNFDGTIVREKLDTEGKGIEDNAEQKINDLGKRFEQDKEKLEKEYEAIANDSALGRSEKIAQLRELKNAVENLKKEYEEQVSEQVEELKEEHDEVVEVLEKGVEEAQEQENRLRGIRLEAGSMDGSAAADEAAKVRDSFESTKKEHIEAMSLKMEQLRIQQRTMRASKLSGK